MGKGRRYYWFRLQEDFIQNDMVDYIMCLENGSDILMIYFLMCFKSINSAGRLEMKLGPDTIPLTTEKMQRDFRWFPLTTIETAVHVLLSTGLIFEDNGTLVISDFGSLVGSISDYGIEKKRQRAGAQMNRL